ncbi:hypothetical protein TWF506_008066 [Arthrobotrys conoides]|uniref:Uncharacterized protein n=1 Tax=Arthrobotrys conoides TaxID=74498 RepID=A0AAN8NCL2_9PEZI
MCIWLWGLNNAQDLRSGYSREAKSGKSDDNGTIDTRTEGSSTIASTSTAATSAHTWDGPSFEEYCYEDYDDEEGSVCDKEEHYERPRMATDQLSPLPSIETPRPRRVRILRRTIGSSCLRRQPTCEFAAAEPLNPYRKGLLWAVKRKQRWW